MTSRREDFTFIGEPNCSHKKEKSPIWTGCRIGLRVLAEPTLCARIVDRISQVSATGKPYSCWDASSKLESTDIEAGFQSELLEGTYRITSWSFCDPQHKIASFVLVRKLRILRLLKGGSYPSYDLLPWHEPSQSFPIRCVVTKNEADSSS
jgi:hypothetical protein